jgi:hypothetical protein
VVLAAIAAFLARELIMPGPVSGSTPGVGPLPTTSTPSQLERNEDTRIDTKSQERDNDFASHLNEQSIIHEKRAIKSQEFDAAEQISQQSVYLPSSGRSAI